MYHQRFLVLAVWCLIFCGLPARAAEPIDIGSQRELFVDDYLIGQLSGDARQVLQKPVPQEVVLVTDKPWEGNTCAYYTIFQDGERYRMYYRGSHYDTQTRKSAHAEVVCYAESRDGIHWTKPELGLCDFAGSKANNIVWNGLGGHNFTPFKDANPACPPEARYKALAGGGGGAKHGLYAFQSADGLHWSLIRNEPVITKGAFDSQNLAFWDPHAKLYREFHREFRGVRDIMGGTSSDFLTWTDPVFLEYPGAPKEHLYTNAIRTYDAGSAPVDRLPDAVSSGTRRPGRAGVHDQPRRVHVPSLAGGPDPRHRAGESRRQSQQLYDVGTGPVARQRQGVLGLRDGSLLHRSGQPRAAFHVSRRRLCVRTRIRRRRATGHQAVAFCRDETDHQRRHCRRGTNPRGNPRHGRPSDRRL